MRPNSGTFYTQSIKLTISQIALKWFDIFVAIAGVTAKSEEFAKIVINEIQINRRLMVSTILE